MTGSNEEIIKDRGGNRTCREYSKAEELEPGFMQSKANWWIDTVALASQNRTTTQSSNVS